MIPEKLPLSVHLEGLFDVLNGELFYGKLLPPTISIRPEKRAPFRFDTPNYQILVGRQLETLPLQNVWEAFLHCMVHMRQYKATGEVPKKYHNRQFLNSALAVGFYVNSHPFFGWSLTTFTSDDALMVPPFHIRAKRMAAFEKVKFDESVLEEAKTQMRSAKAGGKIYSLKYECGCEPPHNSIRSGRRPHSSHPLKARCDICGLPFRCVETNDGSRKADF
jgi:hypothetical protein